MHAVICGAGIAGLSLALRLAHHRWDVTVVERAPGPRTQGYMIDFFGPGYEVAERTGLLPRLTELAYPVGEWAYVDGAGRRRAGLRYDRLARAVDGRLLTLMRPDLELALRERVAGDAELRFGRSVEAIEDAGDGVRVTLTGGARVDADLLVGADGIHSAVRRQVLGDERRFLRHLGLHVAAFRIDDAGLRARLGDDLVLSDTVDRTLGLYRLRSGEVAVLCVHRDAREAVPDDVRGVLRDRYASLGRLASRVLAQVPEGDAVYYDLVAQVEVPAWSRGRVVLVGDACQAVSLLAGQGASLAVAGSYVLAEHLAGGGAVADALARYERRWRPLVTATQEAGRRTAGWFLPSSRAQLRLRRAALALMAVPGVDRALADALTATARTSLATFTPDAVPAR